jgi:hypothetical protein
MSVVAAALAGTQCVQGVVQPDLGKNTKVVNKAHIASNVVAKIKQAVRSAGHHNYVRIKIPLESRKATRSLLLALQQSRALTTVGQFAEFRYYLHDNTVASRCWDIAASSTHTAPSNKTPGFSVDMYKHTNHQTVLTRAKPAVLPKEQQEAVQSAAESANAGDLPLVAVQLSTRKCLDASTQPASHAEKIRFVVRYVFRNSSGYDYVVSLRTPATLLSPPTALPTALPTAPPTALPPTSSGHSTNETTDNETTDKETTDKETTDKETTDKETTDKETTDTETNLFSASATTKQDCVFTVSKAMDLGSSSSSFAFEAINALNLCLQCFNTQLTAQLVES